MNGEILLDRKNQISRVQVSSNLVSKFDVIPVKIAIEFLRKLDKLTLKFS